MDEWLAMWNLLCQRWGGEKGGSAEEKARQVEKLSGRILQNWGNWAGRRRLKYYQHSLSAHFAHQVSSIRVALDLRACRTKKRRSARVQWTPTMLVAQLLSATTVL